jgi:AraC-like DNA-binding protein
LLQQGALRPVFAQNQLRAYAAPARETLQTHVRARHPTGSLYRVKTASRIGPPLEPLDQRRHHGTPLDRATYARTPRCPLELGGRFRFRLWLSRSFALDRPVDLRAIAAAAHVTPIHLVRRFRAELGTTPVAYLWRQRVATGIELLTSTGLPVSEIPPARASGPSTTSPAGSKPHRRGADSAPAPALA